MCWHSRPKLLWNHLLPHFPPIWTASLVPDQLPNTFVSKKLPLPPEALPTPLTQAYTPISLNLPLVLITPWPCTLSHLLAGRWPISSTSSRVSKDNDHTVYFWLSPQFPSTFHAEKEVTIPLLQLLLCTLGPAWCKDSIGTDIAQSQELVKKTTCPPM